MKLNWGSTMDYKSMTREELIDHICRLENQRAFTYEDRMKLEILDNSPFTIWASDRDCKIRLWTGQCEALYGYTSADAINQDFVNLFVAPDEQVAARRDQLSIIDENAVFHNIANDIGKNGNTLQLITVCSRIKDPETGEYWNAEMGLVIDYLEEEKERLRLIIAESQQIKSCVSSFIRETRGFKEQFYNRSRILNSTIKECEKKAISRGMRREFKHRREELEFKLSKLEYDLGNTIDEFYAKIQTCYSYESCVDSLHAYREKYVKLLDAIEELMLDLAELAQEYNGDASEVLLRKEIMNEVFSNSAHLISTLDNLILYVDNELADFRRLGNVDPNSSRLIKLEKHRTEVEIIKQEVNKITSQVLERLVSESSSELLMEIREDMLQNIVRISSKIEERKQRIEGVR